MVREQRKKYHEAEKVGTEEIAVNCPGCYVTMAFTRRFFNKTLRYMPEELLSAYGDTISRPLKKRLPLFVTSFAGGTPKMIADGLKQFKAPQAPETLS